MRCKTARDAPLDWRAPASGATARTAATALLGALLLSNAACAAGLEKSHGSATKAAAASKAANNLSEYTWYDGGRERKVYLAPQLVADFAGGVKAALPEAREVHARGGAVLYELDGDSDVRSLRATLSARGTDAAVSPVFFDDGGGAGRRRALPGNVVVEFDAERDADAVNAWAGEQGLTILRKLSFGNYYLVQSPAGLASLDLANRLQQSGAVRSAQPNWWTEVVTR